MVERASAAVKRKREEREKRVVERGEFTRDIQDAQYAGTYSGSSASSSSAVEVKDVDMSAPLADQEMEGNCKTIELDNDIMFTKYRSIQLPMRGHTSYITIATMPLADEKDQLE